MRRNQSSITFNYLVPHFYFPNRSFTKSFLLKLLITEGKKIEKINFVFCNDAYLLNLNQSYLKHDTLTDIITFELSEAPQPLLSDIFISIERVKENASKFNIPFLHELLRVIIHGLLHLCGFKDKSIEQKKMMTQMENKYLKKYFVSRETTKHLT